MEIKKYIVTFLKAKNKEGLVCFINKRVSFIEKFYAGSTPSFGEVWEVDVTKTIDKINLVRPIRRVETSKYVFYDETVNKWKIVRLSGSVTYCNEEYDSDKIEKVINFSYWGKIALIKKCFFSNENYEMEEQSVLAQDIYVNDRCPMWAIGLYNEKGKAFCNYFFKELEKEQKRLMVQEDWEVIKNQTRKLYIRGY